MGRAWDESRWDALAAEAFVGIKEWRLQHPKATFAEIEGALDALLSRLRARLLEDVALASAATDLPAADVADRSACLRCGGRLAARGQATRTVTVTHGQTVTWARSYAVCSACGTGLFPSRGRGGDGRTGIVRRGVRR